MLGTRWLVRLPVWIYRAGLGFVFGRRLVMIQHTGRTSGRARFVVLECVTRSADGSPLVISGFGEKAQWCRNVSANPLVHLWWGTRRRVPARVERLSVEAARIAVRTYAVEHPRAWRQLQPTFENILGEPLDPRTMRLPMFAILPSDVRHT